MRDLRPAAGPCDLSQTQGHWPLSGKGTQCQVPWLPWEAGFSGIASLGTTLTNNYRLGEIDRWHGMTTPSPVPGKINQEHLSQGAEGCDSVARSSWDPVQGPPLQPWEYWPPQMCPCGPCLGSEVGLKPCEEDTVVSGANILSNRESHKPGPERMRTTTSPAFQALGE